MHVFKAAELVEASDATANFSSDVGSRFRSLRRTLGMPPTSSVIGSVGRRTSRITKRKAIVAKSTTRVPKQLHADTSTPLSHCYHRLFRRCSYRENG